MISKQIRVALFLLLVANAIVLSNVEVGVVYSNGDPLGQKVTESRNLFGPAYGISMVYGIERVELGYVALFEVIPNTQLDTDEADAVQQHQVIFDNSIVARLLLRSSDKAVTPFISLGTDFVVSLKDVERSDLNGTRLTVDVGSGVNLRLRNLALSIAGAIVPAMYDPSIRKVITAPVLFAKGSISVRYRL